MAFIAIAQVATFVAVAGNRTSSRLLFSSARRSMKVYDLSCEQNHRFEGWFASEDDYLAQANKAVIHCPICDSSSITRQLSAPRLNLSGAKVTRDKDTATQVQSQLLDFVRKMISKTEDVGERFAEEARRMHYNETPERAIRGVASMEECQALNDEGIDVVSLPLPATLKQPLQ